MNTILSGCMQPVLVLTIGLYSLGVSADELSVYAPGGAKFAMEGAAAAFERDTGHSIKFTFGTGGGIKKQLAAGAPADVTVIAAVAADELAAKGLLDTDTRKEIGSVGVGIGVKSGAAYPKTATVDELRAALLAAKSITYADPARGGLIGTYFAKTVLPELGIVSQMAGKTVLSGGGEEAIKRVANGEVEMVIVQASEIVAVPGAEIAGSLPKSLQKEVPYSAAVLKASQQGETAKSFVAYLVSDRGQAAFKAAGFEPASSR